MESLRNLGALVGRIFLAAIFVYSGLGKITHMGAFMAATSAHFARAGIPPNLAQSGLYASAAIELGGGLLMIAGLKARWAALIIFLWLIPVTLIFHVADYYQAAQQHEVNGMVIQQIMYLKNLAMMGGLLILAAMGPGRLSIDARTSAPGVSATRRAA